MTGPRNIYTGGKGHFLSSLFIEHSQPLLCNADRDSFPISFSQAGTHTSRSRRLSLMLLLAIQVADATERASALEPDRLGFLAKSTTF